MSNQRPDNVVELKHKSSDRKSTIVFDDRGVCSACRYAEIKETRIDWALREKELIDLLDRHRRQDGSYDCIIPGSGGKDSAYISHLLKYKYRMNPLTVTWSPHQYTEIGRRNFEQWIRAGFDNILYTPNGTLHRLLTRLAFENLCHPFQPFIIGQKLIAPRYSALYNIPLIIYGESPVEYGNNLSDADRPVMPPSFYAQKTDLDSLYLGGVSGRELIEHHGVGFRDLNPYLPVEEERLRRIGTEVHFISYYLKWDSQENYYYAAQHIGFEANTERTPGTYSKYSSIDDAIDPFHYYTTLIKFGIGRATYDSAQEIRNNKITRAEGIALVRRYDAEFPSKYFQSFLDYTGITAERFHEVIDRARSPHLWEKVGTEWRLRHSIE